MKTLQDRLAELKEELAPQMQSRMIFLLNPKDVKPLEAIVAWTAIPKTDVRNIQVDDNATMIDLWKAAPPDILAYSTALGCNLRQAQNRLSQLQQLNIIYPDGSVAENAITLVKIYINNQVNKINFETKKFKPKDD